MATRGRPIPATTVQQIARLAAAQSVRRTARACEVSPTTVQKYKPRKVK